VPTPCHCGQTRRRLTPSSSWPSVGEDLGCGI
jgi:hypothetical protein